MKPDFLCLAYELSKILGDSKLASCVKPNHTKPNQTKPNEMKPNQTKPKRTEIPSDKKS